MFFKLQRAALLFFSPIFENQNPYHMSDRALILGAAGVALLYFLTRTAMNLNRLIFKIAGFQNVAIANGSLNATVNILIQNPTDSSFPLYDTVLNADVLVNNFSVGKAQTAINALLVPGQQIIVPLQVTMAASNFAGGVAALLAAFQGSTNIINVLGTVTIKGVTLPLNLTYGN